MMSNKEKISCVYGYLLNKEVLLKNDMTSKRDLLKHHSNTSYVSE